MTTNVLIDNEHMFLFSKRSLYRESGRGKARVLENKYEREDKTSRSCQKKRTFGKYPKVKKKKEEEKLKPTMVYLFSI
jgi:hypothetical protein